MQRDCNATCNALLSEDNELGSNFSECSAAAQNSAAVRKFSGLQMSEETTDTEVTAAIDLLLTNLADERWRNAVEIEAAADGLGLSIQTLARARHTLGVETRQLMGCPKQWRLPSQDAVR
jgi:hypothetical protein